MKSCTCNMHVACIIQMKYALTLYVYVHARSMHVSCNMHWFGTFSCMLHACYMKNAYNISVSFQVLMYVEVGGVSIIITLRDSKQIPIAHTLPICIKHDMLHVTYMWHTCYITVTPITCTMHVNIILTYIPQAQDFVKGTYSLCLVRGKLLHVPIQKQQQSSANYCNGIYFNLQVTQTILSYEPR